ncbi:MAG: SAM-dependent methyltransferase [Candidatus Tectomicrobia bacterium]|uniref:S-adenosyl-L-methionine-dependent methyltransferase n=1 Tax=Tectimicrobiota bacterium TaxID=2528274 RepID=A0A932CR00_UNCTE|nr:SAM-dependent methyltransferase [Candidatus Tectomicrobia bacterium]
MVEQRGSATALSVAGIRAMESEKPPEERLFVDPYARQFAGEAGMHFATKARQIVPEILRRVALRTRFIDDYVRACIREGISQTVIFGAGYDARAYRIEELQPEARVFEIDHPATAALKRKKVEKIFGGFPSRVAYIAIDFLEETYTDLEGKLRSGGYDPQHTTLFILEGLISYLDRESVDQLLRFIAAFSGPGSAIVLNYTDLEKRGEKFGRLMEQNARGGEPMTFSIDPAGLEEMLRQRGFDQIATVSLAELELQYYGESIMEDLAHHFTTARSRG